MKKKDSDMRDFHFLELERSKVNFFPMTWTIVHPISASSPMQGITENELIEKDAEFIVLLKAFDESFSQTVYSRSSYKANEVKWGEKFTYIIAREDGNFTMDIGRLDETEKAKLNHA